MLNPVGGVHEGSMGRAVCILGRQDLPATDPDYSKLLRSLDHPDCNYPDCDDRLGRRVCVLGRQDLPATDPDYTKLPRSLYHPDCNYPDGGGRMGGRCELGGDRIFLPLILIVPCFESIFFEVFTIMIVMNLMVA